MNKIFYKIAGIYLLGIIPMTVIVLLLIYNSISEHYTDNISDHLTKLNYSLQNEILKTLESDNPEKLDRQIKNYGRKLKTRITVIDTKGAVIADSEEDPSTMENHATRTEISQAFSGKKGVSQRYSTTVKKNMLYVALPLKVNNNVVAVTRVSLYTDNIDILISGLMSGIIQTVIIIGILSLLLVLLLSKTLTKPIKDLADASKRVSDGDFDTKVFVKNHNELRELADSFNSMTQKIKNLFEQQKMNREELLGIISSMKESLLVLGPDNRIIMFNNSFQKLIGSEGLKGKLFWEVIKDLKVNKLIEYVRQKKSHKTNEVFIENRHYLCSGSYLVSKDEVVLVLFDISERKKLDEMKKDFVTNVSHELRTPLTAIQGFIETIEEEVPEHVKGYLDVISRNATRLTAIVNDLIKVSELEDNNIQLNIKEFDINSLIPGVSKMFEKRLKEKNLEFSINIAPDLPIIHADLDKIEQLFINLIDNAIKYTNEGKIDVSVKNIDSNKILIEIKDTGIGMSNQVHERIFERFYTVDKSRSRQNCGTGLGLSIVKHIVKLHNGEIKLESELNKGTIFRVILPSTYTMENI